MPRAPAVSCDGPTAGGATSVIVVSPTATMSFGVTGVGPTTRVPFTKVPFELPMSSTVRPPALAIKVAWRREVRGSPSNRPSQSRPTSRSAVTTTRIGLRPGWTTCTTTSATGPACHAETPGTYGCADGYPGWRSRGQRKAKAMRAARRIIVLAGILALAVCAPITWTQAGAQSAGDGESPPEITFVKIMCADFGAIPENVNTPNNLSARPENTTLGESNGDTAVGEEDAPRRLRPGRGLAVRAGLRRERDQRPAREREHGRSRARPDHGRDVPAERRPGRAPRRSAAPRERGRAGRIRVRHPALRHGQQERRQSRVPGLGRPAGLRGLQRRALR